MKTVYIALGSNLGDRGENLRVAREKIESPTLRIRRCSSIWETEPREMPDQPWFLNQVIEAETTLFPRQLLARLLTIEREMGRRRLTPRGPRLIDLDILLFGNTVVHAPELEIPHPRMQERRFVLEPLAELAPDLRPFPDRRPFKDRRTVRELLAEVKNQAARRL